MNRDRQLAVLLRRAQWLLDDVAHEVAAGRCGEPDRKTVANVLDDLATVLRDQDASHAFARNQQGHEPPPAT